VKQLTELPLSGNEHFPAFFCRGIFSPGTPPFSFNFNREVTFLFEAVEQGIDCARAHFVPMAAKLFNHPEAHQRFLGGMMKNVQPDESANKLSVIRFLGFYVDNFSAHSCNVQEDIET
jgi:hypothetical protein